MIWGSSMFVFLLKAPIDDQFVCMLVLVGMGGFAVGTFSSHLRSFSGYVNGLGGSVMAALAYQLAQALGHPVGMAFQARAGQGLFGGLAKPCSDSGSLTPRFAKASPACEQGGWPESGS